MSYQLLLLSFFIVCDYRSIAYAACLYCIIYISSMVMLHFGTIIFRRLWRIYRHRYEHYTTCVSILFDRLRRLVAHFQRVQNNATVVVSTHWISITWENHTIYLPRNATKTEEIKYLVNNERSVNHPPYIEWMISPRQMGVTSITVIGPSHKPRVFTGNVIPVYIPDDVTVDDIE